MQRIFYITLLALLFSITAYRLFFHLSHPPVEQWDERTNIAVVENSLANRSLPILYFQDKPFFEKPPLWYIVSAATVTALHDSTFSLRVVSAFSGLLILMLTSYIAWVWWGPIAAIISWIVLLGSHQLFVTNAGNYFSSHTFRSADLDAMQILFILIATMASMHMPSNRLMSLFAGVATGLAVLTKGPLGIIPLFVATALFTNSEKPAKRNIYRAWVIFLITAVPWYLYMMIYFGLSFLQAHIGYHILERAITPIEGHSSSWWQFFYVIGNHKMFFSWELLMGSVAWIEINTLYRDQKILYILLLTILFFIIPTFMQTKLVWYILPFYPFAALLIAAATANVITFARKPKQP
jgi:4-amino-4-deoxy-L-arabinose transferase-like glycosyltransferase